MPEISIVIAAVAGLGSFLAPCMLPVIPAFLAYISGTTITEIQRNSGTVNLVSSSVAGQHTLTIIAQSGFEIYSFTFG